MNNYTYFHFYIFASYFIYLYMEKNKLTLIIDANWLLISRASVLMSNFNKNLSDLSKEQSQTELEELLAKSINVILHRFPIIDNVIIISDGGSWRKQLPIPETISGTIYKGNRIQAEEIDWTYIFGALSNITAKASDLGLTVSHALNVEGDDWAWYWSRRLNNDGINCMIWTSDNDLKQLIQVNNSTSAFTVWYNDKNGLWMPDSIKASDNEVDFFIQMEYFSPTLDALKNKVTSNKHFYIDPNSIINSKIICGDAGDNILPIFRYKKGSRNFRITEKDWKLIQEDLNINNITDLIKEQNKIATNIANQKKFQQYKPIISDIETMIGYNIKLVWLHESTIPDTIIQTMNQQEYLIYNIPYLRSNFKVLLKENDDIQNLFESI